MRVGFVRELPDRRRRRALPVPCKAALLAICVLAQLTNLAPAWAERRNAPPHDVEVVAHATVIKNKSKNIKVSVPFADAAVGSSDIAEVVPISDHQLYIVGKKIGTTNVLLYDASQQLIGVVDVEVGMDTSSLQSRIRGASGGGGIHVDDVEGKLVLSGDGGDAQTVERAMNVAKGLGSGDPVNALKLGSPQQVMLQVRFVEANRSAARALGVRWQGIWNNRVAGVVGTQAPTSKFGVPAGTFGTPPGPAPVSVVDSVANSVSGASPVATVIAQLVNSSRGNLDVVLSALEEQGVVRRLAEPNLVALSGESADFLAGGEFPVPLVSSASAGALPTVTITYKEFGVKLRFTPTVLARGVISLKLEPEVSDLDPALGVQVGGVAVPGLVTRRARTTVELRDGQTFAIAGLLQAKSGRTVDQVPWLGSVPVLGALFRSSEFQANETELLAFVTPHLIKPVPPGKQLKTPLDTSLAANDVDFFLGGRAELPKSPPTYTTQTGAEQPVFGGVAPGAPAASPAAAPFLERLQQFFSTASPDSSAK
jgi:pilus assembly protein CpaC